MTREQAINYLIISGFSEEQVSEVVRALTYKSKTGNWREDIDNNRRWDRVRFYCSECGDWQTYGKSNYCPNCGAKMEKVRDNKNGNFIV